MENGGSWLSRIKDSILDLVTNPHRTPAEGDFIAQAEAMARGESSAATAVQEDKPRVAKSRVSNSAELPGFIAALVLTGMALVSVVAAIGNGTADVRARLVHLGILIALTIGYRRKSAVAALGLIAYPLIMAFTRTIFLSFPQSASLVANWQMQRMPELPRWMMFLVAAPAILLNHALQTASTSWVLLPLGVIIVGGARAMSERRPRDMTMALAMVGLPTVAIMGALVALAVSSRETEMATPVPLGPEAMRTALEGGDPIAQKNACAAIGVATDPPATELFGLVMQAARSSTQETRGTCLAALKPFGVAAVDALPLLREALHDESPFTRITAVTSLAAIASHTNHLEVLPDIAAAAGDLDPQVRRFAILSLSAFADAIESTLPIARMALADPNVDVRSSAASVLEALGPKAAPAADDLIAGLKDSDPAFRERAARALQAMGPAAKRAVPQLNEATRDSEETVRAAAYDALAAISPDSPDRITGLITQLMDADDSVRAQGLVALEKMGPDAAAAVPSIIPLLSSKAIYIRVFAVDTLTAIGPGAAPALPRLREMLNEKLVTPEIEAQRLPETLEKAIRTISPQK